jgi:hypothetical protein
MKKLSLAVIGFCLLATTGAFAGQDRPVGWDKLNEAVSALRQSVETLKGYAKDRKYISFTYSNPHEALSQIEDAKSFRDHYAEFYKVRARYIEMAANDSFPDLDQETKRVARILNRSAEMGAWNRAEVAAKTLKEARDNLHFDTHRRPSEKQIRDAEKALKANHEEIFGKLNARQKSATAVVREVTDIISSLGSKATPPQARASESDSKSTVGESLAGDDSAQPNAGLGF